MLKNVLLCRESNGLIQIAYHVTTPGPAWTHIARQIIAPISTFTKPFDAVRQASWLSGSELDVFRKA